MVLLYHNQLKKAPEPKYEEPKYEEEEIDEEKEKKEKRAASDKEKDLGNAEYKKRKFESALNHYEKAWNFDQANVAVLTNKAAVLFEMEKYNETIETCQKAIDIGKEHRADFKLIARAYARIGNSHVKLNDLVLALKNFNHSLAEHRHPDVLARVKEIEKLKKQQDELSYINPTLSDEHREKGNVLFKNSKFAEAIKEYSEAIKRNPKDSKNYSNRAASYTKLMAFAEADKDCDKAIELDPKFIKAYVRKAAIAFGKQDYTKSIDICNEAMELDIEGKHHEELQGQIMRCYGAINANQNNDNKEDVQKKAMSNPEVQQILADPVMQSILQQMQDDPKAAQDHMKNPAIAAKIRTLINSGILKVGR